jgi:hypothetical protein
MAKIISLSQKLSLKFYILSTMVLGVGYSEFNNNISLEEYSRIYDMLLGNVTGQREGRGERHG